MKTALITGGSRGIGGAVAKRLAAEGCRVAICYRENAEAAAAVAKEVDGAALCCDVSDPVQVRKMVDTVLEKFCQLDILVCNAGVAWQGLTQDMGDTDYRRIMGTDLDGVFYCCRAVLPRMIHEKAGCIVNISSIWGQRGASCEAAYSAAKAALIGLTRSLAMELAPSGIRVNCVAPGVIQTDMVQVLGEETLCALA